MSEPTKKEEKPAPSLPEVVWAAARWVVEQETLTRLAVVAFLIVVGAAGVVYAQDAGVKYIAPLEAHITSTDRKLDQHITDEAQAREAALRKLDAAEERNAGRFTVLYNTMLTGRPQPGAEELKRPVVAEPKDAGP